MNKCSCPTFSKYVCISCEPTVCQSCKRIFNEKCLQLFLLFPDNNGIDINGFCQNCVKLNLVKNIFNMNQKS